MRINPEILSTKPTHKDLASGCDVKIIKSTFGYSLDGRACYSAEIMSGPDAGKYTTVYADKLVAIEDCFFSNKVEARAFKNGMIYAGAGGEAQLDTDGKTVWHKSDFDGKIRRINPDPSSLWVVAKKVGE